MLGIIDAKLVFAKIYHQFQSPTRHDPLLAVRRQIIDLPEPLDKIAYWFAWRLGQILHNLSYNSGGGQQGDSIAHFNKEQTPHHPRAVVVNSGRVPTLYEHID